MKKFLVPIALMLSILMLLTSCDAIGEGIVNVLPEGVGDVLKDLAPGVFGEKDDPEANIAFIVNNINEGKSFESILKEQEEEQNVDEMIAELKEQITTLTGEVNFKVNDDGEKISGFGAVKDKVLYLEADGSKAYVFIEDDFNLVSVSGSDGDWYGDVEDSLKKYFEMYENGELEEELEDEMDDEASEFIEELMTLRLPKATLEDVIYDPDTGRYYLSDSYIETVVDELSAKILNTYFDVYPDRDEEEIDEIYDTIEEVIADTLSVFDFQIWFYVVCEEYTGMGFSADSVGDLYDLGDSFEEIEVLNFSVDMKPGYSEFKLFCEGEEAYEKIDVTVTLEETLNEEEELEKCKVTVNATVPFIENERISDGEYYYESKTVYIYGLQTIVASFDMDLANLEGNGTVLSAKYRSSVSDIEAYEQGYYDTKKSYSSDYTKQYSRKNSTVDFALLIVAENDGQNLSVDVSSKVNDQFNDNSSKFSLEAEISKTADNMPSVPKAVERERTNALKEYEENGGEEDVKETPEYDYGW